MSKFLNRFELTKELYKIIDEAKEYLILISPYFKLNGQLKEVLSKHLQNKKFSLTIVYGKNEEQKQKSLNDEDMDFFKKFLNIEIRYHKRLHAKLYVNETNCLLTSMNLHDFSMNENIEFGILTKSKDLDTLTGAINFLKPNLLPESLDAKAFEFCEYIIDKSEIEFEKKVETQKSFWGLFTKHGESNIITEKKRNGFCIRIGISIPYNPEHPLSPEAYKLWSQYKNPDYSEKYCHSCGKKYKTSFRKPLCNECIPPFE